MRFFSFDGNVHFYSFDGKFIFAVLAENTFLWFWRQNVFFAVFSRKVRLYRFVGKIYFYSFDRKVRFRGFGWKVQFYGFGRKVYFTGICIFMFFLRKMYCYDFGEKCVFGFDEKIYLQKIRTLVWKNIFVLRSYFFTELDTSSCRCIMKVHPHLDENLKWFFRNVVGDPYKCYTIMH